MINVNSEISSEYINTLPLKTFEGQIVVVSTLNELSKAVEELKTANLLGFDTETKPVFKKGVKLKISMLQLSTKDKAYLFRINKIGLPKQLTNILQDKTILKVGVAVHEDIRGLKKISNFTPEQFIDLQTIAKTNQINALSLRKLAAIILGVKVSKKQQLSNWDNAELDKAQITYAATDAWICYEIYSKLSELNIKLT